MFYSSSPRTPAVLAKIRLSKMNQDFRSDECSVELLPCSDVFTTSLSASSNFCDKSSPIIRRENAWNIWFCKNCCFPVSRAPKSAEKLIDKRSFRSFWPKRKQIFDTSVRFFTSPWWFTSVSFLQVLEAFHVWVFYKYLLLYSTLYWIGVWQILFVLGQIFIDVNGQNIEQII